MIQQSLCIYVLPTCPSSLKFKYLYEWLTHPPFWEYNNRNSLKLCVFSTTTFRYDLRITETPSGPRRTDWGTGLARKKFSSCDGHPTNHTARSSSNLGSLKSSRGGRKGPFQLCRWVGISARKHHEKRAGECLALVMVFLLKRHMSHKCLLGEKTALMLNGFYFSPWTVFGMWEPGTWIRLTAGNY